MAGIVANVAQLTECPWPGCCRRDVGMDEISSRLDSSSIFQIVKCVHNLARLLGGTVFIALLQQPLETFNSFDDNVLLSKGHVVYHGPPEMILDHVEGLGFTLPPCKGIADFL